MKQFFHILVLLSALTVSGQDSTANKNAPLHFFGFLDASIVSADVEGMHNGPRSGLVLTHAPTGWGIAYEHQVLTFPGEGPTIHGDGWFGPWSEEPEDKVDFNSLMVVKEFNTSSPFFRPGLEAGISFVKYHRDVLTHDPILTALQHYAPHLERCMGIDLRGKLLLVFSRRVGMEASVQLNINELRPYSSFNIGFVLGVLRHKQEARP